jgi:hypothetical protein
LTVLVCLSISGARAQVLPDPNLLIPFAPPTYNGPLAGNGGVFMFGSINTGATPGVTLWAFNGNTSAVLGYPLVFPAAVPFTVGPVNLPNLAPLLLHNGLGPPGVDPAEDDNPQGLGGAAGGPGGRTMHQRRHHLVPANQDIVPWVVEDDELMRRLVSTVVKAEMDAAQMEGGVLTIDYMGFEGTGVPPVASTVWPSINGFTAAGGAAANAVIYAPVPVQPQPQVLSDLSPNVFNQFSLGAPNGIAWATGTQNIGDTDQPAPQAPGLLVIADYTAAGVVPQVTSTVLESPYSPYADKLLIWNDVGGFLPLAQYIIVPCRDGVEIYDPALVGVGGELIKVVAAAPGKEICSNVSFFGPSPYDDSPPTAYFIVLERDQGEFQQVGGGVNFIVFDLLAGSIASRGAVGPRGTMPALDAIYARGPLDMLRGFNDIAVAPPARDANGAWDPTAVPAATAWFGAWEPNNSLLATPTSQVRPFGAMVGVENYGLAAYTDNGLGFNAGGPIPAGTNTRYFSPVRDVSGAIFTSLPLLPLPNPAFPVPVGEVSTNPIFNPLPGGNVVNQNLITWYWDNGVGIPDVSGIGTGFGVAVLDVLATWTNTNPAYPGGILVDGTANNTYPGSPDRSQETITERPLFGYFNYPIASIVFAQRQAGIETFVATLIAGTPRNLYAVGRFGPQTPPPVDPLAWLYQKRRHTAWNPPSGLHQAINPGFGQPGYPFTLGLDTVGVIQSTQAWALANPQPVADDWVSTFVNWRWSVFFGTFVPSLQGAVYNDWASARIGVGLGIAPLIPVGALDATTSPPPTQPNPAMGFPAFGPALGYPYYAASGQTPLWADWTGGGSLLLNPIVTRSVLRSHTNPFPLQGNDAWVGIGAQQMLKYSLGVNQLPNSAGRTVGFVDEPSIIMAHVDQVGAGAGLSPAFGMGPGQFRVNFVHIQADPAAGAGPGFEATYVNNPGPPADGLVPLPVGEVVTTEILAWPIPLIVP